MAGSHETSGELTFRYFPKFFYVEKMKAVDIAKKLGEIKGESLQKQLFT